MEINYSEILFETIGMIAGNYESSVQAIQDEISEEEEITATPVVDPMADIVQMEKLSISNIKLTQEQVIKLNKSWNFTKTHDYDLISLEVSITAISEEIIDKSYGIQLILSTNTKQHIVQFDSTEMLGNPYNFIQALQKKSFNLSEIKNLRSIEIRLFNNSNIDVQFDDINLVVGYSFGSYTAAAGSLVLYTDDEKMEYETNALGELGAGATRDMYARWIYQDENDNYYAITHNNYTDLPLGANVFWYKYSPNATAYDEFGGKNWIRIDSNAFILQNYVFNPEVEQEQFKIVIVNTNQDNGQLSINTSNILTFANKKENQLEIVRNGVIKLNDDSNGIYPYYSWDGYIDDKFGYQTSVVRLMELTYNSSIEYIELAKKIKEVIWKIPQEHMKFVAENLEVEEDGYKIKGGYRVEQIIEEDTEGYSILTIKVLNAADREIETDGKARTELAELFSTTFGIKGRRISSPWKNDIVCSIILDDNSEYTFSRNVGFTVAGESGSEYSVIVRIKDSAGNVCNAVPVEASDYSLVLFVYDSDGKSIIKDCSITYTSFYSPKGEEKKLDNGIYPIDKIDGLSTLGLIFTITLPSGNKLVKYFGIPTCDSTINPTIVRYNGPSEIVYNHAGVKPEFNDSNIELIGINGITWSNDLSSLPFGFVLKTDDDNVYQLTVGNSYFQEWTGPQYYLSAKLNSDEVWRQPLLIYQNPYFSSLINEWDNALKIDNDNNVIFSSAYIAGSKDDNNKFTGAILGELGKITDGQKSSETGLFGYQEGTQIFGFKTDGTAFIGPSSSGRILFNGNKGQIYSGNFDGWKKEIINQDGEDKEIILIGTLNEDDYGTLGTYLDLENGLLITNNGYFRGTISIGGDATSPNFHVDKDGNVKMAGGIKLNGNITWGSGSSPTQVVYTQVSSPTKPQDGTQYSEFLPESSTDWHQTFNSLADKFASYTYDGGQTWGNPIKVVGEDGKNAESNQIVTIYCRTNQKSPPSLSKDSLVLQGSGWYVWSVGQISNSASTTPYEFRAQVILDTEELKDTQDRPCFKVLSVVRAPELYKVYNDSEIDPVNYATFWKLTDGGTVQGLFYGDYTETINGTSTSKKGLFINASFIKTGSLDASLIKTGTLIVGDAFTADKKNEKVTIGGFQVNKLYLDCTQQLTSALYDSGTTLGGYITDSSMILAPAGLYFSHSEHSHLPHPAFGINDVEPYWSMVFGKYCGFNQRDGGMYFGYNELLDTYNNKTEGKILQYLKLGGKEGLRIVSRYYKEDIKDYQNRQFGLYTRYNATGKYYTLALSSDDRMTLESYKSSSATTKSYIELNNTSLWLGLYHANTSNKYSRMYFTEGAVIIGDDTMGPEFSVPCKIYGSLYLNDESITGSWRGVKNTIENFDTRYSILFDNLNPVRYKYNYGTSDRYHLGFILDELKTAIDAAGLSTQEVAAYCVSDPETGEGGIRYGEFIALLVKEVQTLKQELKALKEKKEINNETN